MSVFDQRGQRVESQTKEGEEFKGLPQPLPSELVRLALAEATLAYIVKHLGRVCAHYEICRHNSCQDSFAAWNLANEYLHNPNGLRAYLNEHGS